MLWLIILLCVTIFGRPGLPRSHPYPAPFDPFEQTDSVGPRWDRWKTRLQYYIDAREITVDNRRRALLLHLAGLLNTSHDYANWASTVNSINTRSTRLFIRTSLLNIVIPPHVVDASFAENPLLLSIHCWIARSIESANFQAANIENTSS